jgi:predicted RNA-binding protein with PUA-like domain
MPYWILKTEPSTYSLENLKKDGHTHWDGVRNYQARNNLKSMKKGDHCMIYHSVGPKEIVGTARVIKTFYPDPKDLDWVNVDIEFESELKKPVKLAEIKEHKALQNIALVRQGRLSVCPITKDDWDAIMKLAS